jgi:hypothetical protein
MRARLERCLSGRLSGSYPPGEHDLEVIVDELDPLDELSIVLRTVTEGVQQEHPECRRVVFAAPEGSVDVVSAAREVGFRYVVDVEVAGESLSLMVAEPGWVTVVDMDLDRVPHT